MEERKQKANGRIHVTDFPMDYYLIEFGILPRKYEFSVKLCEKKDYFHSLSKTKVETEIFECSDSHE